MAFDETFDAIVVGSGGGVCAAVTLADAGKSVVVLEQSDLLGGSTAMSGGLMWIPDNPLAKRAGLDDSLVSGRAYMNARIGDVGPASSELRREAYLNAGPRMLSLLEGLGVKFLLAPKWPDYNGEMPGAVQGGRSLGAEIYDTKKLGEWGPRLRRSPYTSLAVRCTEAALVGITFRSAGAFLTLLRILARNQLGKVMSRHLVGMGSALQGRMIEVALRQKVDFRVNCRVTDILMENGRAVGVVADQQGRTIRFGAKDGVILNPGGFSRNAEMRRKYQPQPSSDKWTIANPGGENGGLIMAAMRIGAKTDLMDEAVWQLMSVLPDGLGVPHNTDVGKPHCIVVNQAGERFCNEAQSYVDTGHDQYSKGSVPAWAVMDSQFKNRYFWGVFPPGKPSAEWVSKGYMKRADSLADLARQCSIDPQSLQATVSRFNQFVDRGVDQDFHRGERAFDRYWGDPTNRPNPCLGKVEKAPYYAVALYPGDVGTWGGVLANENAQVVLENGDVVPNLYAIGNGSAGVMGRSYPGAGASVGASYVFGYIAANHLARRNT